MTKFQLMLKTIKDGNILWQGKSKDQALQCAISAATRNEVFIFEPNVNLGKAEVKEPSCDEVEIDPPFEVFSIEYADHKDVTCYITIPRNEDIVKVWGCCLMVEEIEDGHRYYALLRSNDGRYNVAVSETGWSGIVKNILDRLNKEMCGTEAVNEFISFKGQGKKKINIKRDKIFIVTSKAAKSKKIYQNRSIDWNHSWQVRGHWKHMRCLACSGQGCVECNFTSKRKGFIGLDRNGNRTVEGKTWVRHYIKQEDKSILKKTRVVE